MMEAENHHYILSALFQFISDYIDVLHCEKIIASNDWVKQPK